MTLTDAFTRGRRRGRFPAAMRPMMSGSAFGGGQYGRDNQLPADMMKSRGTMPGGGMMNPGRWTGRRWNARWKQVWDESERTISSEDMA